MSPIWAAKPIWAANRVMSGARMFVTDIKDADAVTAAFSRALGHVRPTGTLVAIFALYNPDWNCEIEAEAVLGAGQ